MNQVLFIPTYNESENISRLLDQIVALSMKNLKIVIVDDHSPDGTASIIKKYMENNSNIYLVERMGTRGRGTAGIVGYDFALKLGADEIVEMDSDFSHPPSELPKLFDGLSRADIVIASRLTDGAVDGRPTLRRVITKLANIYVKFWLQSPRHKSRVIDWTTGYRAYRKTVFEKIPPATLNAKGPSIIQEVLYRALNLGFTVEEIPFHMIDRVSGKSTFNRKVAIQSLMSILEYRFFYHEEQNKIQFVPQASIRSERKYYALTGY